MPVLDETEQAIWEMLAHRGDEEARRRAARARQGMEEAFPEAAVTHFDAYLPACAGLPDQGDVHVVAAAMKTQAAVIVTENLKHFPADQLRTFNMEPKSADDFIADTITLEPGRAVAAIRRMRLRLNKPEMNADQLLRSMEGQGLIETVNVLRTYLESL